MAGGLFIDMAGATRRGTYGLERKRPVYVHVCCWRCRETKKGEMSDVFDRVCDVGTVCGWVEAGPYKNIGGWDTVLRYVSSTERNGYVWIQLCWWHRKREVSKKCGLTHLLVFFEVVYFFAATGEIWYLKLLFCCFWVELCV